jgi:hypothetical protein
MELRRLTVKDSESVLAFGYRNLTWEKAEDGNSYAGYSNRYLAINASEVWDLGFPCGSCTILFGRTSETNIEMSPHAVSERLNAGVAGLDDELIRSCSRVVPVGEYIVCRLSMKPRLVHPAGSEDYFTHEFERTRQHGHDPGTAYYRGRTGLLPPEVGLGAWTLLVEMAVPLYPIDRCDELTVEEWRLKLHSGHAPAALTLTTIQDVWEYYDLEPGSQPNRHIVLTHFIMDGHHKMLAASQDRGDIDVLAFINLENRPGEYWPDDVAGALLTNLPE